MGLIGRTRPIGTMRPVGWLGGDSPEQRPRSGLPDLATCIYRDERFFSLDSILCGRTVLLQKPGGCLGAPVMTRQPVGSNCQEEACGISGKFHIRARAVVVRSPFGARSVGVLRGAGRNFGKISDPQLLHFLPRDCLLLVGIVLPQGLVRVLLAAALAQQLLL